MPSRVKSTGPSRDLKKLQGLKEGPCSCLVWSKEEVREEARRWQGPDHRSYRLVVWILFSVKPIKLWDFRPGHQDFRTRFSHYRNGFQRYIFKAVEPFYQMKCYERPPANAKQRRDVSICFKQEDPWVLSLPLLLTPCSEP